MPFDSRCQKKNNIKLLELIRIDFLIYFHPSIINNLFFFLFLPPQQFLILHDVTSTCPHGYKK